MTRTTLTLALAIVTASVSAADPAPKKMVWKVGEVTREALVYIPDAATQTESPVVFAFHGHGGRMQNAAEKFAYHKRWPQAICVYMQGLPTVTKNDPQGKRSGWQPGVGANDDRDLKFFDEVLQTLKKDFKVDAKRVYATGHSNGGGFTYLLWANRGDVFAAVAPSAAGAGGLRAGKDVKPLPCLHVAGEKDPTVPFENQKRTMDAVRKLNGCEDEGKPWDKNGALVGTAYTSKGGTPFVSLIHPGDHKFPDEAPKLIVKFFQEHAKK